jgi:cystathionine beta-lyase/cystathionine gamma-synthase
LAHRNAYAIALFLESHAGVKRVVYPGLPSHPQYELAKRQQHGSGAMITFYCIGGREQAAAFLQNVRLRVCVCVCMDLNTFSLYLFSRFYFVHLLFLSLLY